MKQEFSEENTVFVGDKPTKKYITAVMSQLTDGHEKVAVKARGDKIKKAVDTVERLRNGYVDQLRIHDVDLGTDEMSADHTDEDTVRVSKIHIYLANQPN